MKHRLISIAVLILSVFSVSVSGCNKLVSNSVSLTDSNITVIEVWHYYNGPQKLAFDALVTEFNETVGIEKHIAVEAVNQGSIFDLTTKVLDTANKKVGTGKIPDIFSAYSDTVFEIDKMGLVADISQYLTQEELNEYVPSYIEEGRISGIDSLKIFPVAKSIEILMINKTDWDEFSSATGTSVGSLDTLEGLTKTAETYYNWTDSQTKVPDDGEAFFGRDAMANYILIGSNSLGKPLFSVDNNEVSIQLDEDVMRKLWDNFYVPYINGYFAAFGKFRSDDVKTGDIISFVGSSSGAAYFPKEVIPNDNTSYPIKSLTLPAPTFQDGEPYCVQQGAGMAISKSTNEKEQACVEFLKWFTEEDRNIAFSVKSGYLPVKSSANNINTIDKVLDGLSDFTVSTGVYDSLELSSQIVKEHILYAPPVFEKGRDVRDILEIAMIEKANSDLADIKKQMELGTSRKKAVAAFDTDENFKKWFGEFQKSIMNILK